MHRVVANIVYLLSLYLYLNYIYTHICIYIYPISISISLNVNAFLYLHIHIYNHNPTRILSPDAYASHRREQSALNYGTTYLFMQAIHVIIKLYYLVPNINLSISAHQTIN